MATAPGGMVMTTRIKQMPDKTRSAVLTIIFTVFMLALGDAAIKGLSADFTLWQIFCLRSALVVPVLFIMLRFSRWRSSIRPKSFGWTLSRSVMLTLMWVTYYASLPHVNLSVAAASYYTSPLFITIFAAVFLGDGIRRMGWVAIALGFIGVLLVLQPKIEDFNWYALLPVSSAIMYALAMILTRSHCQSENVLVLSIWLNLSMLFTGAVITIALILMPPSSQMIAGHEFLIGPWAEMGLTEWSTMGVLAVTIMIGSIGAAYAYQNGAPATIATFDFAYVAFALLWSVALFKDVPNPAGMAGMCLIVFAGILAVRAKAN